MKQLVLYLSLLCSCAIMAQEQKYILLDSLTAHYQVKQYTLDTSPYGVKNTIEIYNVFWGKYILLISVMPDFNSSSNWESTEFEQIKNKLFPSKNLFKSVDKRTFSMEKEDNNTTHLTLKLVKKIKNKYYVSKYCWIESFYCIDVSNNMLIATANYIINTQQPTISINTLRTTYKECFPHLKFPLDWDEYPPTGIPKHQQQIYLSDIKNKGKDTTYLFYQFANYLDRGIFQFAYIKNKGIVAGTYEDYFFPKGEVTFLKNKVKLKRLPENELLWAEELKKEWAEKEKAKK